MQTTVNTLKIEKDGTLVPVKINIEVSAGIGIHVVNMKDTGIKELLLRTITAIQASGYKIPGKKIVISFSEEITTLFSLNDAAVAVALLIATKQIEPTIKYDIINISGELGLDGSLRTPTFVCPQYGSCENRICEISSDNCKGRCLHQWPNEDTKYNLPDWQMYVVPTELDTNLFINTDVYSCPANSLGDIIKILQTKDSYAEKESTLTD